MSDAYADLELKMSKIRQARDIELALDLCARGIANRGVIYRIAAESDYGVGAGNGSQGGAERSIVLTLTVAESAEVFDFVRSLITTRLAALKVELGL